MHVPLHAGTCRCVPLYTQAGRFLCGGMEGAEGIDDPDRDGTAAELHDADHDVFDVMW